MKLLDYLKIKKMIGGSGGGESTEPVSVLKITNAYYLFYSGARLDLLDSMKVDTSESANFDLVFGYCSKLTNVPELDTSNGTSFNAMFLYCSSLTTIPELDTSNGTNFSQMFRQCSKLTNVPELDTSKGTNFSGTFDYCSSLTNVPELDTSNGTNFSQMFRRCSKLTTIPELDTSKGTGFSEMFQECYVLTTIPELDARGCTNFLNVVYRCAALTTCLFKNIKANLQVGSGTDYGHLLTVDSLTHLIYECRDTGSSKTLTVGSANLEKLANVYVKTIEITDEMRAEDDLIDEKLPFVVCESTDEGATLITDYVGFKNWQLK